MASSSSITLLINCYKLLKVSPPVPRSLSLYSSTTPTNLFIGGYDSSKKINGIFSRHGIFSYQATPLINNNPFAACSVHTTTPTIYPDDESKQADHLRYVLEYYEFEKNPYLSTGPEKFCNLEEDEDALYARLDMPGIVKEGLVLQVVNGSLCISGDECASKSKFQAEESRVYVTAIAVPADKYRTDQIRALLKNGVLRIVVPKVKNEEKRTGSAVVHNNISVEDLPDQYGCGSLTLSSSSHIHGSDDTISPTPPSNTLMMTEGEKAKIIKYAAGKKLIFVCRKTDNYMRAVNLFQDNIFILKGPVKILSYETVGEVKYLRLDMPGVGKDGVKVWLEGDGGFLCFEGVEDEEDKDLRFDKETQLRKYEGCVPIENSDQFKACFENGVLRVSMPFDVEEFNKWSSSSSSEFNVEEHNKKVIEFMNKRMMSQQQEMDDC